MLSMISHDKMINKGKQMTLWLICNHHKSILLSILEIHAKIPWETLII